MTPTARRGAIRAALTITAAALLASAAITDLLNPRITSGNEDRYVEGYTAGVKRRRAKQRNQRRLLRLVS